MSVTHPFAEPVRLMRDFSGQVAISIAASAVAAAFFAIPEGLIPGTGKAEPAPAAWSAPLTQDGKFATRHEAQSPQARLDTAGGPATPAALAMPLAIEWSTPAPAPEILVAMRPAAQPQRVAQADPATPARRAKPELARQELARQDLARQDMARPELAVQPLVIAPAAFAERPDQPRPPGLIGRVVSEPAARAAGIVAGAAGMVGAAGSWTVAQASSLLPRW